MDDEICQKCGKPIARRARANVWQGDKIVCTTCINLLKGAERRLAGMQKIAGKAHTPWLIQDGRKELGPLTTVQLIQLLRHRKVDWSANIWREGMTKWLPVGRLFTIPELNDGRLELREFGQGDGTA